MQAVNDEIETIHLYMVREEKKKSSHIPPLLCAFLCILSIVAVTVYSAQHPYFEHATLQVKAVFLPLKTFRSIVPVIPTGLKTYPALTAHGTLTLTNGSVIAQTFPSNILFPGKNGIEVVTDTPVFIPPGNANGYGIAHVPAHVVVSGKIGNIPAYAIDRVEGSSIYIRNPSSFTGGRNAHSVKLVTPQDRQTALEKARGVLKNRTTGKLLASPCKENVLNTNSLSVKWTCQFFTYTVPSYMRVTNVRLVEKTVLVDFVFVPRPRIRMFK